MDYHIFEQRLLETIFTTDVPITPATIAFLYKLSMEKASDFLQKAVVAGVLTMDADEEGNLIYQHPNRVRLLPSEPRPHAMASRWQSSAFGSPDLYRDPAFGFSSTDHPALGRISGFQNPSVLVTEKASGALGDPLSPLEAQADPIAGMQATQGLSTPSLEERGTSSQKSKCLFCQKEIFVGTKQCPHCHEYLDYYLRQYMQGRFGQREYQPVLYQPQTQALQKSSSRLEGALLSFFLPGLGQMCNGQVVLGAMWLVLTIIGYAFVGYGLIWPGFILHALCVAHAASRQSKLQQR